MTREALLGWLVAALAVLGDSLVEWLVAIFQHFFAAMV